MKLKPIYLMLACLVVATLSITSCTTAKTVTQTVANTTITQWTAAVTNTATVTQPPQVFTVTLPVQTNTVTLAPVTETLPPVTQTFTSPPVTTTATATVTSPPITSYLPSPTATPPTTPPAPTIPITAKEALTLSIYKIMPIGNTADLVVLKDTAPQQFFLTFKVKNTSNVAFSNVKFMLKFLSNVPDNAGDTFGVVTQDNPPTWNKYSFTNGTYYFLSAPMNIAADANLEYTLTVNFRLATAAAANGYLLPMVEVAVGY